MVATNPLNISSTGVPYFNGTAFTAPTLTQHGVMIAGASNAIVSLGVATNGQFAIGSTGAAPLLGNILSADGSVTITNTAGGIDISAVASILTIGAFGSTPNADGLSLSGALSNVLNLQPANATNAGAISIAAQDFAGVKTLLSAPIFSTLTGVLSGNGSSAVSASAITQHSTLVAGASNAIVSVAPSTAGFILTSNGAASAPSFQAAATAGFVWASISSAPTIATNSGYIATSALTVTLPSAPADGYIVGLANMSAGSVLFEAQGTDKIRMGAGISLDAGSATSASAGDSAVLVYCASPAVWTLASGAQGIWDVV